ncbi:MAG: NAD-dependent epimerase/dehydratase family protein [Bacteroidetes bacterium]|nr:NAD-dependent epimerase/dehydratase family protein [Bacteroidota bacterium]
MKFLVTGGAGFIGSHLCEALINQNITVIVIDDLSSGFENNLVKDDNLDLITDKIQNVRLEAFSNITGIFHLAAQASVPVSIKEFYSSSLNNLQSTLRVFDIARELKIPVVFASSSAIYGNLPLGDDSTGIYEILSPYAQDKLTMEHYAKLCYDLYNIGSIGLRFFNVYGPKQDPKSPYSGVISIFMDKFINHEKVVINGGYQTRDFVYVKDVVDVMIKSMHILLTEKKCMNINVGTGNAISIDCLYEKLAEIFNYRPEIIHRELDHSDPERSDGSFENLLTKLSINNNDFISIEKGLLETVNYYTKNLN